MYFKFDRFIFYFILSYLFFEKVQNRLVKSSENTGKLPEVKKWSLQLHLQFHNKIEYKKKSQYLSFVPPDKFFTNGTPEYSNIGVMAKTIS